MYFVVIKSLGLGARQASVLILPLNCCVCLGKSVSGPEMWFPLLWNGYTWLAAGGIMGDKAHWHGAWHTGSTLFMNLFINPANICWTPILCLGLL